MPERPTPSPTSPLLNDERKKAKPGSYSSIVSVQSESSGSSSVSAEPFEEAVLDCIKGDNFIVDWYGPTDKGNPQNLPLWRKWLVTMSVALYVLTTTFASSAFSAAVAVTAEEFGVEVETMVGLVPCIVLIGGEADVGAYRL
jgi:hypothetical protein